jgi:putrescine aminotransferase
MDQVLAEAGTTAELQELDRRHFLHPFTDSKALHAAGTRVIVRGRGVHVWDSDGRQLLDGMAGLWCVNVGYGREELVEAAARQMRALPYYNCFFNTATPSQIALGARLASLVPAPLRSIYFANSGSEANETALKAARFYWRLAGKPDKQLIIARDYAYHGVTMATASVSGLTAMHPQAGLPLPGLVSRVPAPYWYRHGGDTDPESYGRQVAGALATCIAELGRDRVAAFIAEPIYGAGGVMVPPASYWPEVQRICAENDVLLIADEVVCGFGRTGRWFGSQLLGIAPDIMTMAKGLTSGYAPMSAVALHERIARRIVEDGGEWVHGFTYSGHPVSAAVALANLAILERERLVERVRDDIGPYFQERLASLLEHPLVGEVRGAGLIAGIELVKDKVLRESFDPSLKVAIRVREACYRNGLIIRAARDCMMTAPPLVIARDEVDEMIAILRRSLDSVWAEIREEVTR